MLPPVQLQLMIGPTVPLPAPIDLIQNLQSVEVRHTDTGESGFAITLSIGRQSFAGIPLYDLETNPLVQRGVRVIVTAIVTGIPSVLMDGIVTEVAMTPGAQAGGSSMTLRGRDLTVLMDLEEKDQEHPAQSDNIIVTTLLAGYAQYGIIPMVIPPAAMEVPIPSERVPNQRGTDLAYIRELARRHGHVFYLEPGPAPATSTAYWGPPIRTGIAQRALSVNMGPFTNVKSFDVAQSEHAAELVSGQTQDRQTGQTVPVQSLPVGPRPPLAAMPGSVVAPNLVRRVKHDGGGTSAVQAMANAQGRTDRVADRAVRATGTADGARYGGILKPRQLVGVRGAGFLYNGNWYVERVTHTFKKGTFDQQFQLAREGVGALLPVVIP